MDGPSLDRGAEPAGDRVWISGAGLGLAISRCIIAALDGEIRVENEEGRGSMFCFTLPVEREQAPARSI